MNAEQGRDEVTAGEEIGLDDAYGLETPEDNVRLYRSWASTYESDFMVQHGYVYPQRVNEVLLAHLLTSDGPVLDVGCGTGVGGVELAAGGTWVIDGLDISPEMLAEASAKRNAEDQPIYRQLLEADLTKPLAIDDGAYGTIVSAGTFTHGHVGPEAVAELIRVVRPGGLLVLGINAEHFGERGFGAVLDKEHDAGRIAAPTFVDIAMYDAPSGSHEHADDLSRVAVLRRSGTPPQN